LKYRFSIILMLIAMLLSVFNFYAWTSLYILSIILLLISFYTILASKKREHNYIGITDFIRNEYDTFFLWFALLLLAGKYLMSEPFKSISHYSGLIIIFLVICIGNGLKKKHNNSL
jgi:hypothetical protein